jgi:hypothetical protein
MKAQSKNDFPGVLWNVENEDLEREINLFIDKHQPGESAQEQM